MNTRVGALLASLERAVPTLLPPKREHLNDGRKRRQLIVSIDGHGYPLIAKTFMERDLVNTVKLTTGLC